MFLLSTPEPALNYYLDGLGVDNYTSVLEYKIHAKRLLWKSTSDVGCAISSCVYQDLVDVDVMVCNYDPR